MPFQHVFIGLLRSAHGNGRHGVRTRISKLPSSRRLSSLAARGLQLARARTERLPQAQTKTFTTSTKARNAQREIAVLGGGITGLTAAHYLARYAKNAHITLYEGSERLGGWIHGEKLCVDKENNTEILFQRGPRMLRPYSKSLKYDDAILFDVLHNLRMQMTGFVDDTKVLRRYIYYPDHLVELPMPEPTLADLPKLVRSYLEEPIWDGALMSGLRAYLGRMAYEKNQDWKAMAQEESIGEYFDRVFQDDRITKNVLSAMIHGIYGGDVYKISAKYSIFDHIWRKSKAPSPILPGHAWMESKDLFLLHDLANSDKPHILYRLNETKNFDLMAFDDGLLSLVDGLVTDLKAQKNVTIKPRHWVTSLAYQDGKVSVETKQGTQQRPPKQFDQVVSTLFSKHLASLVRPAGALPSLEETQAVTMMVVNMWFPNYRPPVGPGFGYLVPSTTPDNDECLLGVLFDSDMQFKRDPAPGTKLTAMLGGHYWDGWRQLPTEEMGEAMAKEAVFRQLGIEPSTPVFASAKLCRDCLPQPLVGHKKRMADAHEDLMDAFKGRLSVAGPSYTGTGVLPAMRSAFDVAMAVSHGHGPPWFSNSSPSSSGKQQQNYVDFPPPGLRGVPTDHVGMTGLLGFTLPDREAMLLTEKSQLWGKRWLAPRFDTYLLSSEEGRRLAERVKKVIEGKKE